MYGVASHQKWWTYFDEKFKFHFPGIFPYIKQWQSIYKYIQDTNGFSQNCNNTCWRIHTYIFIYSFALALCSTVGRLLILLFELNLKHFFLCHKSASTFCIWIDGMHVPQVWYGLMKISFHFPRMCTKICHQIPYIY